MSAQEPTATQFIDTAAVAARYGVSEDAVSQWRSRGVGPPYVVVGSKLIRYHLADLDQYDREQRAAPIDVTLRALWNGQAAEVRKALAEMRGGRGVALAALGAAKKHSPWALDAIAAEILKGAETYTVELGWRGLPRVTLVEGQLEMLSLRRRHVHRGGEATILDIGTWQIVERFGGSDASVTLYESASSEGFWLEPKGSRSTSITFPVAKEYGRLPIPSGLYDLLLENSAEFRLAVREGRIREAPVQVIGEAS
jgi:hypothetical protein